MDLSEYSNWRNHAKLSLQPLYSPDEIEIILRWFDNIRGSCERDLVGDESVEAMLVFVNSCDTFDLYNSLMSRLFIYAPLILKGAKQ